VSCPSQRGTGQERRRGRRSAMSQSERDRAREEESSLVERVELFGVCW